MTPVSRVALLATVLGASGSLLPAQPRHNILILVADDLGVDCVGAYAESQTPPPTPNLDGLAARGVLFRNFWSDAVCSPTRACLQTGRYSMRTRVGHTIGNAPPLSHRELTIPQLLDRGGSGYSHAAIGKWHLGPQTDPRHPNDAGWSHFAGLIAGGVSDYYAWPRTVNGVSALSQTYCTTQMVDDALDWIRKQSGPWVCYLAFVSVHVPFHAPPPNLHTQNLAGKDPTVEPMPFHTAMVQALDSEIGRLLAALGPDLQNTDVLFLGDNGTDGAVSRPPFTAAHAKATPYEGGVNVPLIVAGPSVQSPGREVGALVTAVDVFATVAELAGVDPNAVVSPAFPLDSKSFAPYLRDPRQGPLRNTVYAEQFTGASWTSSFANGFATVRDARFKLIRFYGPAGQREELYDLQTDPLERTDLLQSPLNGAEQAELGELRAAIDTQRSPRGALQSYGTASCVGSNQNPTIGGNGIPGLGSTYQVTLSHGAISRPAVLLVGLSDTSWGALRLPFQTVLIGGGSGCDLYCSIDVQLPTATGGAGQASRPITVPWLPDLVGQLLFHTWLIADAAAPNNAMGATLSDGLLAVIGV